MIKYAQIIFFFHSVCKCFVNTTKIMQGKLSNMKEYISCSFELRILPESLNKINDTSVIVRMITNTINYKSVG